MKRTVKGDVTLPSEFFMGDSYRDAIRKSRKAKEDTSVSRAVARSASKARAKVRAQHARVTLYGCGEVVPPDPVQGKMM